MDDLQISDAIPLDDGSYSTDLVDTSGNVVATVTRLADGTSTADVSNTASSGGFDIGGLLTKASTFLDNVAKGTQALNTDVKKVQNAITGAKAGFTAPTTAMPYLIAGGILIVGILALNNRGSRR